MRTLALPDSVEQWSLTTLQEKLIKIGAKIVHRYPERPLRRHPAPHRPVTDRTPA